MMNNEWKIPWLSELISNIAKKKLSPSWSKICMFVDKHPILVNKTNERRGEERRGYEYLEEDHLDNKEMLIVHILSSTFLIWFYQQNLDPTTTIINKKERKRRGVANWGSEGKGSERGRERGKWESEWEREREENTI